LTFYDNIYFIVYSSFNKCEILMLVVLVLLLVLLLLLLMMILS